MSEQTEWLWELGEETPAGGFWRIATGSREEMEWLGSITIPRAGIRLVLRPVRTGG